jgi:hypothetical protein
MPTKKTPEPTISLIAISTKAGQVTDASQLQAAGLFFDKEEVPLKKIVEELTKVQGDIEDVLAKIDTKPRKGFTFSGVEISLGLSAGGSIGIATAGVDAGITLHFTRS